MSKPSLASMTPGMRLFSTPPPQDGSYSVYALRDEEGSYLDEYGVLEESFKYVDNCHIIPSGVTKINNEIISVEFAPKKVSKEGFKYRIKKKIILALEYCGEIWGWRYAI
jgi:hypothetical protein